MTWITKTLTALGLLAGLLASPLLMPGSLTAQQLQLAEAHSGNDYSDPIESSRALILEIMQAQGVPGASVAVGIGDEIVWAEGFGWASVENGVPVTTLTKFRVGSVSKTITASGIGLLMERGQLDLDAPVHVYVPDFPEKRWPGWSSIHERNRDSVKYS